MARSGIILIEDDKLALIQRVRGRNTYYVFPGGRIEPGETAEEAAVREAYEELGVHVELGPLAATVELFDRMYPGERRDHVYFFATAHGGVFGTGNGPEWTDERYSSRGTYTAVWRDINHLSAYDVRPAQLAAIVERRAWQATPITIKETR